MRTLILILFATSIEKSIQIQSEYQRHKLNPSISDQKSSLAFIFDTTGSMYDDLKQLRDGAELILNTALEESDFIEDFVFVPFNDPLVGPATVTKDKAVFKAALDNVTVIGGGDCPEKSAGGIALGLHASRPRSFLYVFTDASAGDYALATPLLDLVQRTQSQVVFILTGHCNDLDQPSFKIYQQVAAASSGQVFNLNKTNVHQVLDFVRNSIRGRSVNLGSAVIPAGHNYTQAVPVDSTLAEVTVSVSGTKPQITVVNPKGEELTGPPQLITTLDLSEIMVVKVLQPEPGNWSITTGSEAEHSVKVVGVSNLTFHHGFSVEKPRSLDETSYRPLQGTYNYMTISLTQVDLPVKINYAEVLALNGTKLFEINLKEYDKGRKIYIAEPFLPPDDFFYISINGFDEYNQELRRIGATAIQAKTPDVPYLTVQKTIEAHLHDRVVLRCNVESLVPVVAMWTNGESRIKAQVSSLQSTVVEYTIEDMRSEDENIYMCTARNAAGTSSATTEVTLLVKPPQVTIVPRNKTFQAGENVTFSCIVITEALLWKYQFIFERIGKQKVEDIPIVPNSQGIYEFNKTLISVTDTNMGNYSCVAASRGGKSIQSTYITIRSRPLAQILGPHSLSRSIHTDIQLICHVENVDEVAWVSPNGTVVKMHEVNGSFNYILDLFNVTLDDDGVWTCNAMKGNFKVSDSVELSLLMKPIVKILEPRNVTILNGTTYYITCNVVAKPEPRIIWHKETERFLKNTITPIGPNTYKSVLTLDSNKEAVNDTYFCFGENSQGIDQDSAIINVRREMALVKGFRDLSVDLYSEINLHCKFDSFPAPSITWYHNGTLINGNENLRILENGASLAVQRIEFENFGLYKCEADNGFEKMSVNGTLSVTTGLEKPLLEKITAQVVARKGMSITITCSVLKGNPKPTFKWDYKAKHSSNYKSLPTDAIVESGDLTIPVADVNHEGIYKCTAENVIGKDEYEVNLVIQFPPEIENKIEAENETLLIKGNDKVTLSCKATGFPPPIIVWSKDQMPLIYSRNVYLNDENDLVIEKANYYDSGVYTCNVISPLGAVQKNFTLVVYVPPKILLPDIEPKIEVLEGQLVELPCRSEGIPTPQIEWLQNGEIISDRRKFIDEFSLRFVANLTDFGDYTCIVRNRYGNASVTYSVFIWVPPSIEPPLETKVNTIMGSNLSLTCSAVGYPVPTIKWEFNRKMLTENSSQVSLNDVGDLFIHKTTSDLEGYYNCIAENFVGVAVKSIIVNVYEPPRILQDKYSGPYIGTTKDMVLLISCRAAGKPKPYILWSKDDYYLDKDMRYEIDTDGTLIIKTPSEELSGLYTCIAKNVVGLANKTLEVNIYSVPNQMQNDEASNSVTVLEGANTTIDCPVRTSDTDVVKWYKDAKLISEGKIIITNAKSENSFTYTCVASNLVGSAYAEIMINVEYPPKFVETNNVNETLNEIDGIELNDDTRGDLRVPETLKKHKLEQLKLEDLSEAEFHNRNGLFDSKVKSVEVVKGDDYYFECGVDAKPNPKIKWFFNSKPLLGEEKNRLKVMNVKLHHSGIYKCVGSNVHGTVLKEFSLKVLEPPYISEFDLLDVELKEGSNATLGCNAKGLPVPQIEWTFNTTVNFNIQNSSLTITNVSTSSEGLYRCDAKNKAGSAHLVYRVTVVEAAGVKEVVLFKGGVGETVIDEVEAVQGENIRLSCIAKGKPVPLTEWIKNGKVVSNNAQDITYADLEIDKVSTVDSGVYVCTVVNEGGSDERRIKFEVLEPPRIFQTLFHNANSSSNVTHLEVLTGQAFFLHCHPYGNPVPEVYWFRNGQPLRFFDDSMISTDYSEVIVVKEAVYEYSGNYTCVARNKVGEANIVYVVDVLVPPPSLKESTKIVKVPVGNKLYLPCPVEGSPLPFVTWVKHPYIEIGDATPRVKLTDDNFTLTIDYAQVSDSGKYSCIMTNKVGTTEVIFEVLVEKPPTIAGNSTNSVEKHVVALKRSVVLKCQADGNPMPKINWLKDTQPLTQSISKAQLVLSNSTIAIWSIEIRDAGTYICLADNSAGSTHRRYQIVVKVPGKWSSWSQWSYCNVTCGLGYQQRTRVCQYVDEHNVTYDKTTKSDRILLDDSICKGPVHDRRKCHMPPCEEEVMEGRWSPWSSWSKCSASCDVGSQTRIRKCRKGRCTGDNVQIRKCPDLPKCQSIQEATGNEKNSIPDDITETGPYIPEATFEVQSDFLEPDVEHVHIKPGFNYSPAHYDVFVTENIDGSSRGPCEPGYRYNTAIATCDDIDECLYDNNKCHSTQVCVNTAGGYQCTCPKGYTALGVGQRCLDINECVQGADGCEFACVNVAGGYVCACPKQLRLHADRHHCVDPTSSYKKRSSAEELETEEFFTTSIDFPARYSKNRN